MKHNLYMFSGRMGAGKDYVADKMGLTKMGFADPMYIISENLFGTSDKNAPGIRKFLQQLGMYGRGHVSDHPDYQFTVERATFIWMIQEIAPDIFRHHDEYRGIDWSEYGKRPDFWVNILVARIENILSDFPNTRIGVVNFRFAEEGRALHDMGALHYHVMCSEETRRERLGDQYKPENQEDVSEQLAILFDELALNPRRLEGEEGDGLPIHIIRGIQSGASVIWNDDPPAPTLNLFGYVSDAVDERELSW